MTETEKDIQAELIEYISTQLLNDRPALQLDPGDDLLSTNLVDSLGVMRIVAFVEEHYGIEVSPADVTIEHFIDVATIARYVRSRQARSV